MLSTSLVQEEWESFMLSKIFSLKIDKLYSFLSLCSYFFLLFFLYNNSLWTNLERVSEDTFYFD